MPDTSDAPSSVAPATPAPTGGENGHASDLLSGSGSDTDSDASGSNASSDGDQDQDEQQQPSEAVDAKAEATAASLHRNGSNDVDEASAAPSAAKTTEDGADSQESDSEDENEEEDGDEDEDESVGGPANDDAMSLSELDDEEPHFKYQRLTGDISDILVKDAASVLVPTEKFLVLGTHWGKVCVLDFNGMLIRTLRSHAASVTDLSVESTLEFVTSSSDDGSVMVQSLFGDEAPLSFTFKRPMKTVELDPDYAKTSRFVAGGMSGEVCLHEKGWLGQKNVVLHQGEGAIYTVKWCGSLIAWGDENGVKIYDLSTSRIMSNIRRSDKHLRPDLYRCRMYWKNASTLLLGWGLTVQIVTVKVGSKADISVTASATPRHTKIAYHLQLDSLVNGVLPHDDAFLVLTYPDTAVDSQGSDVEEEEAPAAAQESVAPRPQIRLLNLQAKDPEMCRDAITVHGYQHVQAQDYALSGLYVPGIEPLFFIMSPKDIVVVKPRDVNDHIAWLMKRDLFEEALDATFGAIKEAKTLWEQHSVVAVGQQYLTQLVDEGNFLKAAAVCRKVLDRDANLWERWIYVFAEYEKLEVITQYVPLENPQLSETVYEIILAHFLNVSPNEFYHLIKAWPPHIYNIKNIISAVEDALEENHDAKTLLECGAYLYGVAEQHVHALECYIKLRDISMVSLMIKNMPSLLSQLMRAHALLWFQLDEYMRETDSRFENDLLSKWGLGGRSSTPPRLPSDKTDVDHHHQSDPLQMVVRDTTQIPIPVVVEQLQRHRIFLHRYLDALFVKDIHISSEYHHLQLELYAEFNPKALMDFLKLSTYYSLDAALEVCERRDMVPEMVYILGRMGNNKRALDVILERMQDIREAIEFAKDQNDEELWDSVINFSMKRPDFVKVLLENVGSHIDPIKVISRIPKHLEIPGLKDAIVKIMRDHYIQISLRKDCQAIIAADVVNSLDKYTGFRRQAFVCSNTMTCSACNEPLFDVLRKYSHFVLFKCNHALHPECAVATQDPAAATTPGGAASKAALYEKRLKHLQTHLARTRRQAPSPISPPYMQSRHLSVVRWLAVLAITSYIVKTKITPAVQVYLRAVYRYRRTVTSCHHQLQSLSTSTSRPTLASVLDTIQRVRELRAQLNNYPTADAYELLSRQVSSLDSSASVDEIFGRFGASTSKIFGASPTDGVKEAVERCRSECRIVKSYAITKRAR
ncbi:Vacuolar protein sorting-associated protein 41 [Sorochytrium milnesiophthora]